MVNDRTIPARKLGIATLVIIALMAVLLAASNSVFAHPIDGDTNHPVDVAGDAENASDSDSQQQVVVNDDGSVTVTRSFDTGWVCDSVRYDSQTDVQVAGEISEIDGSVIDSASASDSAQRTDSVGVCEREHGEVSKTVQIFVSMGESR